MKTKPKQRDLSIEEIIRQCVRFQKRMAKHGAEIRFTMEFWPTKKDESNAP